MSVLYDDSGRVQISGKLTPMEIAELQSTPEGRAALAELQSENPRMAGARTLADFALPGKLAAGGLMGVLAMAAQKAGVPAEVLQAARAAVRGGSKAGKVRSGAKAGVESTVQSAVRTGRRATKPVSPAAKAERDGFKETVTNALRNIETPAAPPPKPMPTAAPVTPPQVDPRAWEELAAASKSGPPKGGRRSLTDIADFDAAGQPAYRLQELAPPMEQGGDIANALRRGRGAEPLVPGARSPLGVEKNAAAEGFERAVAGMNNPAGAASAVSPAATGMGSRYRKLLGGLAGLGGLGAGLGTLDYLSNQGNNSMPELPQGPNLAGKPYDNGMFPGAIESIMSQPPNMQPRRPTGRAMPRKLPTMDMPRPQLDMGGDPEELYGTHSDPLARLQDMDREAFNPAPQIDPSIYGESENYSGMMKKKRNPLMSAIMGIGRGLGKVYGNVE